MPQHSPAPTPARAVYGFVMYISSHVLFIIYLIWAFVPDTYLHYFNIYYYPLKYWAYCIPIQILVLLTIFTFVIYPSINLMLTPNIDSVNTITDRYAHYTYEDTYQNSLDFCICKDKSKCAIDIHVVPEAEIEENTVPPLQDIDIRSVCRKLYLNK